MVELAVFQMYEFKTENIWQKIAVGEKMCHWAFFLKIVKLNL